MRYDLHKKCIFLGKRIDICKSCILWKMGVIYGMAMGAEEKMKRMIQKRRS